MIVFVMLPFLIGGVLIIVYRNSIAALFQFDRATYDTLLGQGRARQIEAKHGERLRRFDPAWGSRIVLFVGVCWVVFSLVVIVGGLA